MGSTLGPQRQDGHRYRRLRQRGPRGQGSASRNNAYGWAALAADYAISFDTNYDDDGDGVGEIGPAGANDLLVIGMGLTFLGSGEADVLFGNGGDDDLTGDGGGDLLDGGVGNDATTGGDGNDTNIVDDICDDVIEAGTADVDLVMAFVLLISGTKIYNVENGTPTWYWATSTATSWTYALVGQRGQQRAGR